MPRMQGWIVALLAVVLAWSTVMTVLGQLTAAAALLPSLGLLVQQVAAATGGPRTRRPPGAEGAPKPAGTEGPLR
ncbi:hypothetical protein AB0P12_16205 [Streptomyces subrutilus]|uniref:Uncharacterized protein n=1 Tax=Streptomyces subrutilus TaxID=36818 RepID=A0A5P2UXZ0_9ACTN|nr:hypothetical protein [Streptomyces subrutilus]QEU82381.1 hypothetical protein CP968_32655 [Streptomyces subrutilus]WSJ28156.1 hypothetical protein OG479_01960 [Streptomyces subrutilus]GGZ70503.1 hypothetical protein GCM10010371_33040 [Streptomyces subrutilus]